MLSCLGVWMNVRYAQEEVPSGLAIEEWRHKAIMGRDQKVRVVYKGFMFPFGHPASLVKVTERKIQRHRSVWVAYLRQRYFIVIRHPDQTYPVQGQPKDGRHMPFRKVTITTAKTPALNQPEGILSGESAQAAFWPRVGGGDFLFHLKGTDWDGQVSEFTCPLIFVSSENNIAYRASKMSQISNHYNSESNKQRRQRDMAGQKVAFAESTSGEPGDTALDTKSMTVSGGVPSAFGVMTTPLLLRNLMPQDDGNNSFQQAGVLCGYPLLEEALVRVPAVAHLMGTAEPVRVRLHHAYVDNGWDGNKNQGEVFIELIEKAGFEFPRDKSGGLASPDMSIGGLSKKFGPIAGDLEELAKGTFDPAKFFEGASAKILGVVDLAEILQKIFNNLGLEVPNLKIKPVYGEGEEGSVIDELASELIPEAIEATLTWEPKVKEFGPFKPKSGCKLKMEGLLRIELAGLDTSFTFTTDLTKFKVDIYFLIFDFDQFTFKVKAGEKPDVDVDLKKVDFGGPLEFVNELRGLLSSGSLFDFSIDVDLTGVSAKLSLAIPSVSVGIFSLDNMKLSLGAALSFVDDPVRLMFAFCSKEDPFTLTISLFGGGGFFAMEVTPDGVELMEAAFEFGGSFSMNVGVASGGCSIMAGVYFKMELNEEEDTTDVILTGYVRVSGHL
ncbi:MAG: hypothetical protein U9Q79_09235, partial [Candidatus Hydrogenedentes bacterium]|nr:hypothetical protein [Candidatus Hydrogenedentota bacterium]